MRGAVLTKKQERAKALRLRRRRSLRCVGCCARSGLCSASFTGSLFTAEPGGTEQEAGKGVLGGNTSNRSSFGGYLLDVVGRNPNPRSYQQAGKVQNESATLPRAGFRGCYRTGQKLRNLPENRGKNIFNTALSVA